MNSDLKCRINVEGDEDWKCHFDNDGDEGRTGSATLMMRGMKGDWKCHIDVEGYEGRL